MTSDYLKQLQLTKQLEQKAKEAAKNRRQAEEKLAEAERTLAEARSMEVDAREAQKTLSEGQAAYGKRDYSAALTAALKVLEELLRLQGMKVEEVLDSALGVLALITDQGEGRQAVEGLVASVRDLLAKGRPKEAMAEARKAGEAAERYADRRMNAMFSQVQRLIDLAEGKKMAVSAKKQALARAIKLHEDGDREASLTKVGSCFKGLQESFSKHLEERAGALLEMAEEASGAGGDVSSITAQVDRARASLADGRIEESLDLMADAELAIVPVLTRSVEARLAAQEERAEWLRVQGLNITRYLTASRKACDAAASGDGEGSLEWLRRAEKALRDNEVELVLEEIGKLRPRLVLAKKINAGIDNVVSKLEEARMATVYGRGKEALELVCEASAELDDSLADHRELEEELEATREVFLQARQMRVISSEASQIVTRSRQSALGGRLRESVEGLAAARAILLRKVQELCARDLLNGQLLVTTGWSIGADVDEDAGELEALTEELMEGDIENVGPRLKELNLSLETALAATAREVLEQADRMTDPSLGLAEMAPARKAYEEARALLEQKMWYLGCARAEDAIDEAIDVQKASLDRLTVQASSLLEIGRLLGIESQTLNQKMADAEYGKMKFSASIRSMNDVITFARSLIRDEMTRSLAQLMRSSGAARKNGVATAHVDRMAEGASKALAAEDMERCFDHLKEAERDLEKTTALHNEVYDLIVVLSRLTAELHLPPESKVPQLLQETKGLFEAGRYDGARTSARKCYQEAEVVGAEVLAPRKVQEAREMVPVIQQLGLDALRAGEAVNGADALVKKGRYSEALTQAKEARKRMVDAATEGIAAEIAETRRMVDQSGMAGHDASALAIVEKAESLLAERRYSDALRAIRFARSEAGQLLALRDAVGRELARVEDALKEVEGLGIEAKDARDIFEQAARYRSSGRNNLVVEMARRALHSARVSAEERLNVELALVEQNANIGELKGADLSSVEADVKNAFLQKVHQHRYTEARKALEIYGRSLAALSELRDQCASSLSRLAEGLVRVPRGSSIMEETENLMAAAQKAYAEGAFRECLGLSEECRASGATALEWHDRCSVRLEDTSNGLLAGEGRRYLDPEIAALMDSARRALSEGRYEDMDWALLKARRLHKRAMMVSTRRGLADLINLVRHFPALGLRAEDLPAEVKMLRDLRMAEPGEVRNLGETVGALRARVRKGIEARISAVRERSERHQGDSSISLSLLSVAERSLAEEKLDQAIELVRDADRAVGTSMAEVQEMRSLSHRYHELDAIATALGTEGRHRDLFRQALRCRDMSSTVHRLREAVAAAERETSHYLPRLEIRASELFNRGPAPALQVRLGEGAGGEVGTIIWPHGRTALPDAMAGNGRVSLSYRALFLSRPFVTVIEPIG